MVFSSLDRRGCVERVQFDQLHSRGLTADAVALLEVAPSSDQSVLLVPEADECGAPPTDLGD
jgi:hypothetical protein